jgi:hypothetical protein
MRRNDAQSLHHKCNPDITRLPHGPHRRNGNPSAWFTFPNINPVAYHARVSPALPRVLILLMVFGDLRAHPSAKSRIESI